MNLLSPVKFQTTAHAFRATQSVNYDFVEPVSNVKMSKKMHVISFGEGDINSEKGAVVKVENILPEQLEIRQYYILQTHINHCVNNGEAINRKLRELMQSVYAKNTQTRSDILKMDFMKLRDVFSEFLKAFKPLRGIEEYNSNQKIKKITKVMNQFIIDRNIYTHGQLALYRPGGTFLIEYLNGQRPEFSEVNLQILDSYNKVYKELEAFLDLIQSLINPKITLPTI